MESVLLKFFFLVLRLNLGCTKCLPSLSLIGFTGVIFNKFNKPEGHSGTNGKKNYFGTVTELMVKQHKP